VSLDDAHVVGKGKSRHDGWRGAVKADQLADLIHAHNKVALVDLDLAKGQTQLDLVGDLDAGAPRQKRHLVLRNIELDRGAGQHRHIKLNLAEVKLEDAGPCLATDAKAAVQGVVDGAGGACGKNRLGDQAGSQRQRQRGGHESASDFHIDAVSFAVDIWGL
jgi:hypothetical protein